MSKSEETEWPQSTISTDSVLSTIQAASRRAFKVNRRLMLPAVLNWTASRTLWRRAWRINNIRRRNPTTRVGFRSCPLLLFTSRVSQMGWCFRRHRKSARTRWDDVWARRKSCRIYKCKWHMMQVLWRDMSTVTAHGRNDSSGWMTTEKTVVSNC